MLNKIRPSLTQSIRKVHTEIWFVHSVLKGAGKAELDERQGWNLKNVGSY